MITQSDSAVCDFSEYVSAHLNNMHPGVVRTLLHECSKDCLAVVALFADLKLRATLLGGLKPETQRAVLEEMYISSPKAAHELQRSLHAFLGALQPFDAASSVDVQAMVSGITSSCPPPGPIRPEDMPPQVHDHDWKEELRSVRQDMLALSARELRTVLQQVSNLDLCLVICVSPYDHELQAHIASGLSVAAAEMIAEDCEAGVEFEPLHVFTAYCDLKAALRQVAQMRPSPQELAGYRELGLRLLAYGEAEFRHVVAEHMSNEALIVLLVLLDGLDGTLARRIRPLLSKKAWEFFEEDYQILARNPLAREELQHALADLPEKLTAAGHPLPEPLAIPPESKPSLLGSVKRWMTRGPKDTVH